MTQYRFQRETVIGLDRDSIVSRFSRTERLTDILPSWLQIRSRNPLSPVSDGELLEYRLRVHGIPFSWTTRIEGWKSPSCFVDRQVEGPYRSWVYEHRFRALPRRQTLAIDTIDYEVPGGFLESFVQRFAQYELERIFDYREARLHELFPPRR